MKKYNVIVYMQSTAKTDIEVEAIDADDAQAMVMKSIELNEIDNLAWNVKDVEFTPGKVTEITVF